MRASSSDVSCKVVMTIFDSYSKTVMRNLIGQEKMGLNKRNKNEVSGFEVMQYVSETYGQEDMYPSEFVVTDGYGHCCVVTLNGCIKPCFFCLKNRGRC